MATETSRDEGGQPFRRLSKPGQSRVGTIAGLRRSLERDGIVGQVGHRETGIDG